MPFGFVFLFRSELHILLLGHGAGPGDFDRERGGRFDAFCTQIIGRGETPRAAVEHEDAHAH